MSQGRLSPDEYEALLVAAEELQENYVWPDGIARVYPGFLMRVNLPDGGFSWLRAEAGPLIDLLTPATRALYDERITREQLIHFRHAFLTSVNASTGGRPVRVIPARPRNEQAAQAVEAVINQAAQIGVVANVLRPFAVQQPLVRQALGWVAAIGTIGTIASMVWSVREEIGQIWDAGKRWVFAPRASNSVPEPQPNQTAEEFVQQLQQFTENAKDVGDLELRQLKPIERALEQRLDVPPAPVTWAVLTPAPVKLLAVGASVIGYVSGGWKWAALGGLGALFVGTYLTGALSQRAPATPRTEYVDELK